MGKKKPESDVNVTAFDILKAVTSEPAATSHNETSTKKKPMPPAKNPAAVALGRLGGLKGGKARAAKLSPNKRAQIAKKAAETRWKNR